MSRIVLLTTAILLAAQITLAAADDQNLCLTGDGEPQGRLAACTREIGGGSAKGADLARLLVARAGLLRPREPEKALADLNAAIAADGTSAPAYLARGWIYFERKEWDRALADQNRSIALDPKVAEAYYERGRAHGAKGDHAAAFADYDTAVRLDPSKAIFFNARGIARQTQGEWDKSIADFDEALRIAPRFLVAYLNRARTYMRRRELDKALADADAALRIDPKYVRGHLQRGYVLLEMQDFDGALAAFNAAAVIDPKSPLTAAARGNVLVERREFDRAIEEFTTALEFEPGSAPILRGRARAYFGKGDLDLAMTDINAAIKINPNSPLLFNTRGLVYHARRDFDEAVADFTEAIRLDPSRAAPFTNRGRTYNARKEFDKALADLNEAVRLGPNSSLPYWNRAISFENKRDLDKALEDWRAVQRLDPNNKNAPKAIRRLERIKSGALVPDQRVALVIGNGDYGPGGKLANPVNDASDFATLLRKLGFDVVEGHNLNKRRMEAVIKEFERKLGRASIALFYYAGHGTQIDGENQLIPIDFNFDRAADLKKSAVNVAEVLTKMEADQRVNLIFLDACRDNPFGELKGLAQPKGLAPIQNAIGTLTAFATKPYHVAYDGAGRNSPFTAALLKYTPTPGLEIGTVLKRVRADVIQATGGKQVPFDESSLITDVVLVQQ